MDIKENLPNYNNIPYYWIGSLSIINTAVFPKISL